MNKNAMDVLFECNYILRTIITGVWNFSIEKHSALRKDVKLIFSIVIQFVPIIHSCSSR